MLKVVEALVNVFNALYVDFLFTFLRGKIFLVHLGDLRILGHQLFQSNIICLLARLFGLLSCLLFDLGAFLLAVPRKGDLQDAASDRLVVVF